MDKLEDKNMTSKQKSSLSKCPLCAGKLENKRITHPQQFEGKVIILENVPAQVCNQCGEILLTPAIVEHLQELVWSAITPKRTDQVPVYDLAESF